MAETHRTDFPFAAEESRSGQGFLDYEVFAHTGRDVEASRKSACAVCQKYLCRKYVTTRDRLKGMLPARAKFVLKRIIDRM